jgi:lysophospholipase L1-like esterase
MIGINDIFGNKSIEETVRNYQTIIKLLKQKNIVIILRNPPAMPGRLEETTPCHE